MTTLSIIIPVYNEKNTIKRILKLIEQVELKDIQKEIIIVDDKSTDGTRETLERLRDKYAIIFKEKNEGKGAAIKQGFLRASGDIILIQDADLEYNPNEYSRLIGPILDGQADVVYGSRFIGSDPHRGLFFWHYIGNRFLTFLCNVVANLNLTDMETGFKAFKKEAIHSIFLKEKQFC